MAVAGIDINHPASEHYEDKEASISTNARSDGNHLDPSLAEKGCTIGAGTSRKSESLSFKQKELGPYCQEANSGFIDSTKTSLPDNIMSAESKEDNICGADEMITQLPTMFKGATPLVGCSSSQTLPGGNVCDRVDTIDGSTCKEIEHHQIHSHTRDKQMQGIHSSGSDGNSHYHISCWNQLADMGYNIAEGASRNFRAPQENLQRSILKDRTNIGKYSPNNKEHTNDRKGKERISSKEESDRDSSHESVESNNSKRLFSKGKRTLSIDLENAESTKRLKKLGDESSCSSLFIGQGSSFLNWITNVAKGFSGSVPKPSQVGTYADSVKPLSDTKNKELGDPGIGFRSFVQTLYHPGLKSLPWTISENHDNKEDFGEVKPLQVSIIPADRIHNKNEFKIEQPVPISYQRPEQCFGETPPATVPKTSSSSSPFHGRIHLVANEHPDMCNWGSSSSSIQNSSVPAPNGSLSPHISSGGSEYLGSFWIARLCRKSAMKSPEQDNPDTSSAADRQVEDTGRHLDQPHTENLPPKKDNLTKLNDYSSSDEQVNTLTDELHLPSTSDNCFPKGICRVQKLKSKLNPILPSQRLKKLEPMATIFAKRLDALRNIKSSRLTDDVNTSGSTCFFCGSSGHCLNECSEIKDYERDDLLSKVASFDMSQEMSFCVRCFQINHWAVACPYESEKQKRKNFHGVSQTNSVDADCKQLPVHNAYFTSFEAATNKSEDQNRYMNMQNMPGSETSNLRDENVFLKSGRIEAQDIDKNTMNKYLSDNNKVCGMQIASSSNHMKLEGSQKTQELPVYNSFKQARIYELVRGLRLSRSDIMRMKTTTVPGSAFEGFYLRVRCGKWLDSGGVDYHVACISGTTSDRPHGSSRHHISVDIGGTKCLVDCRVVSNRDFLEEELDLWWSQTQRNADIPTEEALTKKLLERRKLDSLAASGSLFFREGN